MKKIFLLLFAAVCAVASWAQDVVTAKYNGNKLDVELTNTTTFVAFQMDIDLPAGVTVQSIESNLGRLEQGANVQIGGVDTPTPFVIAHNVIDTENNVLRVVAYNLGNHEIKGAEGKLFTINFNNAIEEATIDNIRFVDQALVEQIVEKAIAEKGGLAGDIDGVGGVTIDDVAAALDIFLGKKPYNAAADIDGVGGVTIDDVAAILDIFLGKK